MNQILTFNSKISKFQTYPSVRGFANCLEYTLEIETKASKVHPVFELMRMPTENVSHAEMSIIHESRIH